MCPDPRRGEDHYQILLISHLVNYFYIYPSWEVTSLNPRWRALTSGVSRELIHARQSLLQLPNQAKPTPSLLLQKRIGSRQVHVPVPEIVPFAALHLAFVVRVFKNARRSIEKGQAAPRTAPLPSSHIVPEYYRQYADESMARGDLTQPDNPKGACTTATLGWPKVAYCNCDHILWDLTHNSWYLFVEGAHRANQCLPWPEPRVKRAAGNPGPATTSQLCDTPLCMPVGNDGTTPRGMSEDHCHTPCRKKFSRPLNYRRYWCAPTHEVTAQKLDAEPSRPQTRTQDGLQLESSRGTGKCVNTII
ncbi:hypothetical protein BD779DRAFT_1786693 [Infundibulicybe gibba]|nr:hypothetical protein BD779DRAFT_1786693 [Infundibulicybe gibba]